MERRQACPLVAPTASQRGHAPDLSHQGTSVTSGQKTTGKGSINLVVWNLSKIWGLFVFLEKATNRVQTTTLLSTLEGVFINLLINGGLMI